jgi:hypothetical protein
LKFHIILAYFLAKNCQFDAYSETKSIRTIQNFYFKNLQLYLSSHPSTFDSSIARLNEDLVRIQQWYMANQLFINSSKSQAVIINPCLLPTDVSPQIRLGADTLLQKT